MTNQIVKDRNKLLSTKIIKNLEGRRFEAYYCSTKEEALNKFMSLIPENSSVAWGGSETLLELGVFEELRKGNYKLIDRDKAKSPEERTEIMRSALLSDVFIMSANAISEDGILYNIDGVGNRVAALIYGPKEVIVVVGMNKICKTIEEAYSRARNYAAPVNAYRIYSNSADKDQNTPCKLTGSCNDCKNEGSVCSHIVQTRLCKPSGRIKVILVGEDLGF
ncbi:MAG: lactate utilization protein [Tissierellia bacterium]|nr:lactate utilization protein [Tissierellia bacterium]